MNSTISSMMGPNSVQVCIYPVYGFAGMEDWVILKGGIIFLSRDVRHDCHQVGGCVGDCDCYNGGSGDFDIDDIVDDGDKSIHAEYFKFLKAFTIPHLKYECFLLIYQIKKRNCFIFFLLLLFCFLLSRVM